MVCSDLVSLALPSAAARSVNLSMEEENTIEALLSTLSCPLSVNRSVPVESTLNRTDGVQTADLSSGMLSKGLASGCRLEDGSTEADLSKCGGIRFPKPRAIEPLKDVDVPVDWRTLPVFPTHKDLCGEPLQLPRYVTKVNKRNFAPSACSFHFEVCYKLPGAELVLQTGWTVEMTSAPHVSTHPLPSL